jgi:hypothetical protein
MEQAGLLPGKPRPPSDLREVLAGRAESDHMDRRHFAALYLRYVAQMRHAGEMPP